MHHRAPRRGAECQRRAVRQDVRVRQAIRPLIHRQHRANSGECRPNGPCRAPIRGDLRAVVISRARCQAGELEAAYHARQAARTEVQRHTEAKASRQSIQDTTSGRRVASRQIHPDVATRAPLIAVGGRHHRHRDGVIGVAVFQKPDRINLPVHVEIPVVIEDQRKVRIAMHEPVTDKCPHLIHLAIAVVQHLDGATRRCPPLPRQSPVVVGKQHILGL